MRRWTSRNTPELGKPGQRQSSQAYTDFRDLILDNLHNRHQYCNPPHWHGNYVGRSCQSRCDIWWKTDDRTIGEGKCDGSCVNNMEVPVLSNTWFRFKDPSTDWVRPLKPLKKLVQSGMGWPLKVTISKTYRFDWKFYWVGKEYLNRNPFCRTDYDMVRPGSL